MRAGWQMADQYRVMDRWMDRQTDRHTGRQAGRKPLGAQDDMLKKGYAARRHDGACMHRSRLASRRRCYTCVAQIVNDAVLKFTL